MTTNHYGPIVNLNGASRESLLAQHVSVRDCADQLMTALGAAFPHGRDYQTAAPGTNKHDREAWELYLKQVDDIRRTYNRIAERLATEEYNHQP